MPSNTLTEHKTPAGSAYVEAGTGEPLVLIHGVGLNKQVWGPQLDEFSNIFRVIAYDTIGHGHSPIPTDDVPLDDYFDQLVELLNALNISSANLGGHSMGALITLGFSLKHPERVRRIIPMMAAYDRTPEHQQRSRKVADILAGPGAAALMGSTLERWFIRQDYEDPARLARITRVQGWLQQADKLGYSRAYRIFAENGETYVGRLASIKHRPYLSPPKTILIQRRRCHGAWPLKCSGGKSISCPVNDTWDSIWALKV